MPPAVRVVSRALSAVCRPARRRVDKARAAPETAPSGPEPQQPPRAASVGTTPPAAGTASPSLPTQQTGGVRLVRIERASDEAWAGVATRDDGSESPTDVARRVATLAAGDATALVLFAAIGRLSHGEGLAPGDLAATALPFLLGWALTAPFLGAFSDEARGHDVGAATAAAAKSWAVATPVSLLFRAVSQGRAPPVAFAVVSFVVTGALLVAWRAAAAAQAPKRDRRAAATQNRVGNPLEFLTLLTGLVKRW